MTSVGRQEALGSSGIARVADDVPSYGLSPNSLDSAVRFERTGANATAPTTSLGKYEQTAYTGDVGGYARADDLFATRRNDVILTNYKEPCCFAAGTKVSTPNGDRTIESLKVGDVVWSKPEKGGKPFAAKILATHQRSDQPIYRLKLKSVRADGKAEGETLLVTPGHPFYVPAKRDFIPVIDLKPGDLLQSLADGDTDNTSSEVESLELYLPVGQTFNLTVDVGHTFYVGDLKTWVHNTGPCWLPEGYFGGRGDSKLANIEVDVARGADATANSAAKSSVPPVAIDLPEGSFSISDWTGYPAGVPVPQGPFRLLEGAEYNAARNAANKANSTFRREQGLIGEPVDVHEINPVKFGGSPTESTNKVILPRDVHRQQVTPWWNQLQKDLGR
ncbi:Hint domain-containing protein [Pseudomonas sp. FP597]|uniref:Hint domain-containing protein n=1 Tax=Pseudomonas sp. FP597 TaxID=2954096 RepID=UPI0027339950|nr:Hint domain-containing protein [Pseudomonas sp. FP597]WLI06909.1 Hint domain-containing protein [Pseudomonas sp. FP597]